jgi:hypothetical protein
MNLIRPYKNRTIDPKKLVKVYRHIVHKNPKLYSIVQDGLVVAHTECVTLRDCIFHVRLSGQERVRKERVKNVHAWIEGFVTNEKVVWFPAFKIVYNPYIDNHFTIGNHFYVGQARNVCISQDGVVAVGIIEKGIQIN